MDHRSEFVERNATLYGPAFEITVSLDGSFTHGKVVTMILESKLQNVDYSRLRRERTSGLLISSARLKYLTQKISQQIFDDDTLVLFWGSSITSAVDETLKDAWNESNIPFARQKIR